MLINSPRFRWVVCQLDELRKCLNIESLRRALRTLPKTLDDTYARILMNIDEEFYEYALRVLQWLAFSACPVKLGEVAESIAVDLAGHPKFVLERRLREPR